MLYVLAGLHHEGLYRVAGFHDNIEDIRKEFDLGEFISNFVYMLLYHD